MSANSAPTDGGRVLLAVFAHPDDESFGPGGTLARYAAEGADVWLVCGTDGDAGTVDAEMLANYASTSQLRAAELCCAAQTLGLKGVDWLGYRDSGMAGSSDNQHPKSLYKAPMEEVVGKIVASIRRHRPQVIVCDNQFGGYGHPDHIAVHTVGTRAAELTPVPSVLWATMNRDRIREQMAGAAELMAELDDADGDTPEMDETMGSPESLITHGVDVTATIDAKRRAMVAHASQISEDSWFLKMPADVFEMAFGHEWFVDPANPRSAGDPMIDHVL
ncbi:MAG: PIG-L family deacetylase [Anaerolineae bacterium]|nr:PIG-L family deacetylase [Anaerolineae bacterium]